MLKLSIKDQFGPFKLLNQIEFKDLKGMIQDSLKTRLIKLEVPDVDSLIMELNIQLVENQSLISMTKI